MHAQSATGEEVVAGLTALRERPKCKGEKKGEFKTVAADETGVRTGETRSIGYKASVR